MELKQSCGTEDKGEELSDFALWVRVVVQCEGLREQGGFELVLLQRLEHCIFCQSKIGGLRCCLHPGQAVLSAMGVQGASVGLCNHPW